MTVHSNIELQSLNTFGVKSKAAYYTVFTTAMDLQKSIRWAKENSLLWRVLGGGSNVLFIGNYPGLILHNKLQGIWFEPNDAAHVRVTVKSGENWHQFVQYCVNHGFGGVENLSLIPGSVGAAPIQNIGAYGVELKDVLESVTFLNTDTDEIITLPAEECELGYRDSIFKNELFGKAIVLEVSLLLTRKDHEINTSYGAIKTTLHELGIENPGIRDVSDAVIQIRQSKLPDPSEIGNAGSFFKNPVLDKSLVDQLKEKYPDIPVYPVSETQAKIPAGWLIEKAGFKGKTVGKTGSHDKQALVVVNRGGATGQEIWEYAKSVILEVKRLFGIQLNPEVNLVP